MTHNQTTNDQTSGTNYVPRLDSDASRRALGSAERATERRMHPRFDVNLPAVMFPVYANLHPGDEFVGKVVDVAAEGIGVLLPDVEQKLPTRFCVIGAKDESLFVYETVEIRSSRPTPEGLRVGCCFVSGLADPLNPEILVPRMDAQTMRLRPSLDPAALSKWISVGVLAPHPLDRVKSCPSCHALPTFRSGCLDCGSPNTKSIPLIHHFACAHVGRADEFEQDGMLACPKCRARQLIVGSDFEHLAGPTHCVECNWKAATPGIIGECLMCGLRFPGDDAVEEEVTQFYVPRLDPLALVDEAR